MPFLRILSETINFQLLKIKKNKKIKKFDAKKVIKLNLGCGLAVEKNWINIDGSLNCLFANMPKFILPLLFNLSGSRNYYTLKEYCEILKNNHFVHHDLTHSIPFEDNSVDYIFSSHFLEHLYNKDAQNLLSEALRVLKSKGKIRLSVPDLEYAIKMYKNGKKLDMLNNYFFVEHDNNYYSRHKYMYDFELLSKMFKNAGFENIKRFKFREGSLPELERLDNRPEDSLFIEASKK